MATRFLYVNVEPEERIRCETFRPILNVSRHGRWSNLKELYLVQPNRDENTVDEIGEHVLFSICVAEDTYPARTEQAASNPPKHLHSSS